MTQEEDAKLMERIKDMDISISQYMSDPPNCLYKVKDILLDDTPIKILANGRIELLKNKEAIPHIYDRRLVWRVSMSPETTSFTDDLPFPMTDWNELIYTIYMEGTESNG